MAEISVQRILLLVVSLTKCLEGTELLAHLKKCGDLECETLISRVLALRDHTGPDCRYLNFTEGEEISVYVKLAGEREDLWAGSKGKDFGFFPRDAVKIEEVFISEEVEMPTKESDFLCLLGEGYIFGSEHSELISGDDENMYPYENDEDQKYDIQGDFQPEPDFYTEFEGTLFEEQISAPETPEDFRISSASNGWKEAGNAGSGEQGYTPDWDQALPSLSVPEKQGWFGLRREEAEEKPFEPDTEPAQESSFQSRKLTVEEENDLEKLNNGEPQVELEQDPKSQLDSEAPETSSVLEEQYELPSESEHVLKPEANAWFGGGFTSYLGFGKEDTGLELLSEESNPPLEDGPNSVPLDEEALPPSREISTDKEETVINDSSVLSPSWFYFGFGMLGFAQTNKDGTTSDNGESEDGGGDSHTYPIASDFDPEKKEERETIAAVETEDQTGKESPLEKKGDSGSMLYLKKFFDNPWSFQNLPEDTESPFSKQMLGQEAIVENDKTEKLSTENSPTDRTKDPMMMESRHSPSDMASEIESSLRVHEGIHLKISSSKRNEEDSRSCVDSEVPAVAESDSTVEDALLGVQLVSQAKHVYGFMNSALSPAEILIESCQNRITLETGVQKVLKSGLFLKDMKYSEEIYLHVRAF